MTEPDTTEQRTSFCRGCEAAARCQLGITSLWLDRSGDGPDDVALARIWPPATMEGGAGVVHGGWTAAIFDEVLGRLPLLLGQLAVTRTLTVDYLRPVPVERWLRAHAQVEARANGRWAISGVLVLEASGAGLARARGEWVERAPSHYDCHARWLREQDALALNQCPSP